MRPGYKQTEIGVIPKDWEVVSIGDLASFTSGCGISVSALSQKSVDTPVPVYGGNGIAGYTSRPLVKDPIVVVGRVGQKCGEVYLTSGPAWVTDNALYPRTMFRTIDIRFLGFAMKAAGLNDVKNRNDLPLVTQAIVHSVRIPIPPTITEQAAIAGALSDVDGLLAGLDRLIAKKRAVKTAVMQQLLTGEVRVGEGNGRWITRTFGECFNFLPTGSNSRRELTEHGDVGYIHYGDIHTRWSLVLDCDKETLPHISSDKAKKLPFLQEGDLIIADASEDYEGVGFSVEVKNIRGRKIVAGLHTLLLRADKRILADGYKAHITSVRPVKMALQKIATGISVYGISKTNLRDVEIPLPPTVEEQRAIAAILSDIDAEIAALETRRAKTAAIKQGMMQELLTGRTRLL